MEVITNLNWQPETFIPSQSFSSEVVEEQPKYDHGFSDEEVNRIKAERKALDEKLKLGEQVTLEEFKTIVIPYVRIQRTEDFNLQEKLKKPKVERKAKQPKVPKAKKEPKPKKLTKKEISQMLQNITFKKAGGLPLTEEEEHFLQTI